jgi:glycosyltransferase involved in cell wall biosynthesis
MQVLPITAIVPTRNRAASLERALRSLDPRCIPAEIIVVDASENMETKAVLGKLLDTIPTPCRIRWVAAERPGAATQRNQGCAIATQPVLWFFDDDVLFDEECLERLWRALQADRGLGGVNAMITNQRYQSPGFLSRTIFALMNGKREPTYAGRILGPAINLLPEDSDDLPEVVPVEWLNTTCTLYRREALPEPPFDSMFTGYSLMEDVTLSLRVGRRWKLANVRSAEILHDSQPGSHKSDLQAVSCMELVNRHYVMTEILRRVRWRDYAKLFLWELFQIAVAAKNDRMRAPFWRLLGGKLQALKYILDATGKTSIHAIAKR